LIQKHNDIENQNSWNNNRVQKKAAPFFNPLVQTKLAINKPGDVYEQEADTVADNVMMQDASTKPAFFSPASIQRKCAECEEEEKNMQRKESDNKAMTSSAQTENYISSLSGGDPLSKKEKTFFESRMGYDFSNVRIHNNNKANESASNINALAYTHGNDIIFNSGQYQPGTTEGKKLLAHELTHVVQQKNADTVCRKTYLEEENISDTRTIDSESRVKEVILKTFANANSKLYKYIKDKIDKFKDKAVISKDDADVYGHKYNRINKGSKWADKEVKEHVQGFVDPKHQFNIYLYDRSKYCHAFHEAVHAMSNLPILLQFFGGFLNEGLTQYFTDIIFTEQIGQKCTTHKYPDQLEYASNLVTFMGEDRMAKIFFTNGFSDELNKVAVAFGLKDTNDLFDFKEKRGMEKFLKEKYKIKAGFASGD